MRRILELIFCGMLLVLCRPQIVFSERALTIADQIFDGNELLDDNRLIKVTRIRAGDVYDEESVKLARNRVIEAYRQLGFFHPQVRVEIRRREVAPEIQLFFAINEGDKAKIASVLTKGEVPEDLAPVLKDFRKVWKGRIASDKNLKRLEQQLLFAMRKEGYLQATAHVVSSMEADGKFRVHAEVQPNAPLSLIFEGQTVFTPADLVEPLRLETRRVPFTPNAIRSLCRDIQKLYQSRGYFFAEVDSEALPSEGTRKIYRINIKEGESVRLERLDLSGVSEFSQRKILALMQTQEAGWFVMRRWQPGFVTSEQLAADLLAIEEFYRVRGYRKVRADFSILRYAPGKLALEIKVKEGKRSKISQVEIVWSETAEHPDSADLLLERPKLHRGDAWDADAREIERQRIASKLSELGYPLAKISLETDEAKRLLRYRINAGPHVRVSGLKIEGNQRTADRVVERAITLKPGDAWDKEKLRRSQQALYQLGIFQTVEVGAADQLGSQADEDIVVKLRERETGLLGAGVGIDTEDGLHLSGDLGQRNFLGRGEAFLLSFDGYFKNSDTTRVIDAGAARAGYTIPFFAETAGNLVLEAFAQFDAKLIDEFSYDREGGAISYQYPLSQSLSSTLAWTAYREDLFDVEPQLIIGPDDTGQSFYSLFRGELKLDKRDDVFNPRKGFLSTLNLRWSSEAFGSDLNFVGAGTKHMLYTPLGTAWVWMNSAQVSAVMPYGNTSVVPLGQRLFLGGRQTLRGFTRNAVGPRASDGSVVGGDLAINATSELQYNFTEAVIGVLFLDAGQAFLLNDGGFGGDSHDSSDFRFSPGFGVRYKTPIGPLSIEYGLAMDREFGEREGRLNIGIGTSF